MARLDPKPFPGYPTMPRDAYRDEALFQRWKAEEAAFWAKLDAAEAKLGPTDVVGVRMQFQIADGYAEYVVTKAKPLTLAHIGAGDGYQIGAAHMRGLRVEDVLMQKTHNAFMRNLPRRQPLIALPPVP